RVVVREEPLPAVLGDGWARPEATTRVQDRDSHRRMSRYRSRYPASVAQASSPATRRRRKIDDRVAGPTTSNSVHSDSIAPNIPWFEEIAESITTSTGPSGATSAVVPRICSIGTPRWLVIRKMVAGWGEATTSPSGILSRRY